MITTFLLIAAVLLDDGGVKIEGETEISPAYATFITVTPKGVNLRDRFRGFRVAEDYDDEKCTHWRLVPEPLAKEYKIAPFAYDGKVLGPVKFARNLPPVKFEAGSEMEVEVKRDLPPLSAKLLAMCLAALLTIAGVVYGVFRLLKYLTRRVKEHFMSPIERAWAELERLLKANLPKKGKYKDYYVELTMVVRRYVQRKYGIKAPHLTTEEFLSEFKSDALKAFLENADMIKFAGVEATEEMASEAAASAKAYLQGDAASTKVDPYDGGAR